MLNKNVFQCIDVVVYNMVVYGSGGMDELVRLDGLRSITVMLIGCLYSCRFGMLGMIARYFSCNINGNCYLLGIQMGNGSFSYGLF